MFKHILFPTDGSVLSDAAAVACIGLAKDTGAKVTGLHVTSEFPGFNYSPERPEQTVKKYEENCQVNAKKNMTFIEGAAKLAGVEFEGKNIMSNNPYEAIVQAARDNKCDLIVMASHGRSGIKSLMIGSETQKVLTHCHIPVLVYR